MSCWWAIGSWKRALYVSRTFASRRRRLSGVMLARNSGEWIWEVGDGLIRC